MPQYTRECQNLRHSYGYKLNSDSELFPEVTKLFSGLKLGKKRVKGPNTEDLADNPLLTKASPLIPETKISPKAVRHALRRATSFTIQATKKIMPKDEAKPHRFTDAADPDVPPSQGYKTSQQELDAINRARYKADK